MPTTDEPRYGPAMLALPNDRWRKAVEAYIIAPAGVGNDKGHVAAVRAAGFQGTPGSLWVTAHRIFHDERVQRAVQEEVRRAVTVDGAVARHVISSIMNNPAHPMQFAAAKTVLDKAVPAQLEIQHNHEHTIAPEMMSKAIQIARTYNMPMEKLLGWKLAAQLPKPTAEPLPTTVDAEYVEVVPDVVKVLEEGGYTIAFDTNRNEEYGKPAFKQAEEQLAKLREPEGGW